MSDRSMLPYSPMHSEPLAGPEKQAEMFAKLAARSRPKVSVDGGSAAQAGEKGTPVASDTPVRPKNPQSQDGEAVRSGPAAPLVWLDPVPMAPGSAMQHSACGRYRIDGLGSKGDYRFTVWAIRAPDMGLNKPLGVMGSGPEARALCEAHRASAGSASTEGKP